MHPLLEPVRAALGRALIATDFDGTLSAIVDDPAAAVLVPGAAPVLTALAARAGELAVISGRPIEHLEANLPSGPTLVGLYGLQQRRGEVRTDHPGAARWVPVVAEVAEQARTEGPEGLVVEPKHLSLTLHYRRHPELADDVGALAVRLAERSGLEVRPARMSVELHPPIDEDKGTALARLAAAHDGPVLFAGDDVGDLTAFGALRALGSAGRDVVAVVARSDETDPELLARADVVVDGPEGVLALFAQLLDDEPSAAAS